MAPVRDWPEWARWIAAGVVSVCVALVTITLSFADVKRDASDAKAAARDEAEKREALERRVRVVEDAVVWVKSALRTGRDPDTGASFPWAK